MRPGQAAADVNLGRFANWTNPERNAWNAVRIYAELNGTIDAGDRHCERRTRPRRST